MKPERTTVTLEAGSARLILEKHWHRLNLEELLRLSGITPLCNRHTEYSPECMRELDENLEAVSLHVSRCRRIANYLGRDVKEFEWQPLSARGVARQIEVFIQNGEDSETIARFLERWRNPPAKKGRPAGSTDHDGIALRALELHESDPKKWPWPKVADELLGCKRHVEHVWDSDCTVRLKQAVVRLQIFVRELQSACCIPLP
jgi:hypothetical protein